MSMYSDFKLLLLLLILVSCTQYRVVQKVSSGQIAPSISVMEETSPEPSEAEAVVDSVEMKDGPIIMNAIRDSETGEMVATDIISASRVTARFRNVPERGGFVTIGFDVDVPSALTRSGWKLELSPFMVLQEDTIALAPLYITGQAYREAQLRGYERYNRFLSSIIDDPDHFVRLGQLEIFLKRYFPEIYAMKTDSSFVSDPVAQNLFGVTQREAVLHYRMKWKERVNDRRKGLKDKMFARYVRDPVITEGIRLDTVVKNGSGFTYRYSHRFKSRSGLKKAVVFLTGNLYERGEKLMNMPESDDMTYYISSLSTLADTSPKYRMVILERVVYDNTKAFIDFAQGSSLIDTTLSDNVSELKRVERCINDVASRENLVLDSLVISASCSPEGSYASNSSLAAARAHAVRTYVQGLVPEEWKTSLKVRSVPENWEQFRLLTANDSLLGDVAVRRIMALTEDLSRPDEVERRLSSLSGYRYLREKVYPKLRSVKFDFHLHRSGMQKDTVHTTEIDTAYMAGVEALRQLDYKRAVTLLRPYADYNSALAFVAAEYNHSALDVLNRLDNDDPKVCYLLSVVLSRLDRRDMAAEYFRKALLYDPTLRYRANLDPEMSGFVTEMEY